MTVPIWSATSCTFPGAGLYIGLAPRLELQFVVRLFAPKRLRAIVGASTRFGERGTACPLDYLAVRDPSLVRVIPVKRPPLPNGFRHIKLAFQMAGDPGLSAKLEQLRREAPPGAEAAAGAFVMTIGLPIAGEDDFFKRAIATGQDFAELYTRIRDMGGAGR